MDRDVGWVEVLPLESDQVLARGRLVITDPSDTGAAIVGSPMTPGGVAEPAQWEGRMESLRIDRPLNRATEYRLRFEGNNELRHVRIDVQLNGGNAPEQALVSSVDGELPAAATELGGH